LYQRLQYRALFIAHIIYKVEHVLNKTDKY